MKIRSIILSVIACACFCFVSFANERPHTEILYISGTPKVCLGDETQYIDAEEGMYLESGDKIKTDDDSSLGLGFNKDESNIIEVGNNSDVVVVLGENEKLELLEGRVFVTISELTSGSSFEVRTPTAVTGARGTYWAVIAIKDSTDVETIEGDVYVAAFLEDGKLVGEEIVVFAGYQTTVKRFHSPLPPRKIPRRTLKRRQIRKDEMLRRTLATRSIRRRTIRRRPIRELRAPIRRLR
jgi:hypothetical protein